MENKKLIAIIIWKIKLNLHYHSPTTTNNEYSLSIFFDTGYIFMLSKSQSRRSQVTRYNDEEGT